MHSKTKKKLVMTLICSIFLILSITYFSSAQTTQNKTIYVDDDANADYNNIQDAINAAENGDTIFVYSGIYYENIIVNKSISITGQNNEDTIVDGMQKGDVISVSGLSNNVKISGFTIQNAGFDRYSAGIDIDSYNCTISNNIINGCNMGICVELWSHKCNIFENYIIRNSYGIIIHSVTPNNIKIYRNNFAENYINAYDNSKSVWDFQEEGNYWDDYNGTDKDNDGIGDSPYLINGLTSQDNYPLIEPVQTPGFEIILVIFALIIFITFSRKIEK